MFLTSGFNAGTAAMGAGVAILILLFIVIIYALDFLFTMFVYNNIAPKSSNLVRILCTGLICFAVNIVITYIISLVNKTGVPAFFFISGYLFFLSKKSYGKKLKDRIHTLLIPYILWNLLLLLFYLIVYALGHPLIIFKTNII